MGCIKLFRLEAQITITFSVGRLFSNSNNVFHHWKAGNVNHYVYVAGAMHMLNRDLLILSLFKINGYNWSQSIRYKTVKFS